MTTQIIPTENSGSNTPILQTPSQTQPPPTQTPQQSRIQTPLRTQTPDSVVSTYTLQQKQNNYNTLLQQLGAIAPTVEKA
ncbi:10956_t:CDS:2, partial [Cetraspora pellucida]